MSKDKGILLSEKHGVNPSVMKCLYCGKDKGVALLGKLRDDAEAPREMVVDAVPCDECQAKFDTGFTIFETTENPAKGIAVQKGVYATGSYAVLKMTAQIAKDVIAENPGAKGCYLPYEVYNTVVHGNDKKIV